MTCIVALIIREGRMCTQSKKCTLLQTSTACDSSSQGAALGERGGDLEHGPVHEVPDEDPDWIHNVVHAVAHRIDPPQLPDLRVAKILEDFKGLLHLLGPPPIELGQLHHQLNRIQ